MTCERNSHLARIEQVLIVKVYFERRIIATVFVAHVQDYFRKSLSTATFKRKHNVGWKKAHLRAKCHLDPSSHLATTDMCRELGEGPCPFEGAAAGSPSNTMWPEPRPTFMPSFILIRPTVWPQYTNVTDRQTDRQTDRTGQREQTDNGLIA